MPRMSGRNRDLLGMQPPARVMTEETLSTKLMMKWLVNGDVPFVNPSVMTGRNSGGDPEKFLRVARAWTLYWLQCHCRSAFEREMIDMQAHSTLCWMASYATGPLGHVD